MENGIIKIEGKEIRRLMYRGQPVVTAKMIDELHERPEKTAIHTFLRHKKRLKPEVDYFEVPYEEWSQILSENEELLKCHEMPLQKDEENQEVPNGSSKGGKRGNIYLFTLSGYLMLTKPFTDDRAWRVQGQLVKSYFALQELQAVGRDITGFQRSIMVMQERLLAVTEATSKALQVGFDAMNRAEQAHGKADKALSETEALWASSVRDSDEFRRQRLMMDDLRRELMELEAKTNPPVLPIGQYQYEGKTVRFFVADEVPMLVAEDFVDVIGKGRYGPTQKLKSLGFEDGIDFQIKTSEDLSRLYHLKPGHINARLGISSKTHSIALITPKGMARVYQLAPEFYRWHTEEAVPNFAGLLKTYLKIQAAEGRDD